MKDSRYMETTKPKRTVISHHELMTEWKLVKRESVPVHNWDSIIWQKHDTYVKKLRIRIYVAKQRCMKASKSDFPRELNRLRFLQKSMIFSYDNLVVSVRRVT